VFDALITMRPYKAAMRVEEALAVLRREVEWGWRRADLVSALESLVHESRGEANG
jgi:HD-GYP domain-containing protein (c-di-GMP phosphodiesterase class II)